MREHAGEAMELNQRYLNRQLGRVAADARVRSRMGARPRAVPDRREGDEYLDLYAGYGVFALGRNHPFVKEQLHRRDGGRPAEPAAARRLDARGRARRAAGRPRAGADRRRGAHAARAPRRSRRRSSSPRGDRAHRGILYCERGVPRALDRLAVGQRQRRVPRALRAAAAGLRPGAVRRPRCARRASWRAATSRRSSSSRSRARASTSRPTATWRARRRAVPRGRRAADRRRGADRAGPHRQVPGARALGSPARHGHAVQGAVGRLRAGRRAARQPRRVRRDVRLDGAQRRARLDVRRRRLRRGRGARDADA